jgi:hypothetical protein
MCDAGFEAKVAEGGEENQRYRCLGRAGFILGRDGLCPVGEKFGGLGVDVHGDGVLEALQDLIGGVLQAGVGLVKLAGGLGGELAELIPVGDVREGTKDEIGTHGKSPDEKGLSGLRQPTRLDAVWVVRVPQTMESRS